MKPIRELQFLNWLENYISFNNLMLEFKSNLEIFIFKYFNIKF